jgi:hypothetical protein
LFKIVAHRRLSTLRSRNENKTQTMPSLQAKNNDIVASSARCRSLSLAMFERAS